MEDTKMFLLINEIGFDGSRVCLLKDKKTKNKAGYTKMRKVNLRENKLLGLRG